ncbi:MAG TPA: rhomboid-like protein [Streptosporangiaceae bacterium]
MIPGVAIGLSVAWYLLKGGARWWGWAARLVVRLSPWTRAVYAWALSAPATFTYVVVFTASTIIQQSAPPHLIDLLTTLQSTNLARLRFKPLSGLIDSGLWVADRGNGLSVYIAVFVTVVAWAERRYGPPRMIIIGTAAHVLGSLLTAAVETHAITTGRAPASLAYSTDVGVSYVMVGGVAAAVLLMRGRFRALAAVAFTLLLLAPLLINRTVWDLGHLLAALCGLAAAWIALRTGPPRRPARVSPAAPPPDDDRRDGDGRRGPADQDPA